MRAVLQVPIDQKLRKNAEKKAESDGFSSIQQVVRFFLTKYTLGEIGVGIKEQFPPIKLSKKAAARYDKMTRNIEKGKIKLKSFSSVDELMKDLTS